jgi:hypothetical protein
MPEFQVTVNRWAEQRAIVAVVAETVEAAAIQACGPAALEGAQWRASGEVEEDEVQEVRGPGGELVWSPDLAFARAEKLG